MNMKTALNNVLSGGRKLINVRAEELIEISNQLTKIQNELDTNLNANIEKIRGNTFYTAGEAQKTVDQLAKVNTKFMELVDHYQRLSSLVIHTLDTMQAKDEQVANLIDKKLEV